jgi:hypothetical protein
VVRAGDVVPERRGALAADEQAAGRAHPRASSSIPPPTSSRCSGAKASAKASAASGPSTCTVTATASVSRAAASSASTASSRPGVLRHADHEGPGPVLGLRAQVGGHEGGLRAGPGQDADVRGPKNPSMPHTALTCRLASCTQGRRGRR